MRSDDSVKKDTVENSQTCVPKMRLEGTNKKIHRMPALDGIRYIAAVHIFARHYLWNSPWPWVKNVSYWGNSATPWFMMLSGFGLAIAYGNREHLSWSTFMIGRLSKLYPLYSVGILMGFLPKLCGDSVPWAAFITMMLCLTGYVPTAFINWINAPAHAIGGMVTLYAVFPGSVKILKGCTRQQLCYIIQPLLWLLSAATVLIQYNYNFGILHPIMRLANRIRLFNFLQGVVLGLLYTEHDWSKHAKVLQYLGFSAPFMVYWYIVSSVPHDMPGLSPELRRVCLLTPLQLCMIWYGARNVDPLCRVFGSSLFQTLGATAYGVCIFQHPYVVFFGQAEQYMQQRQWLIIPDGSPISPILQMLLLTILSHYFTRAIMLPAANILSKMFNSLLRMLEGRICERAYRTTLCTLGSTCVGRAVCSIAFVAFYTFYVNWQPCVVSHCGDDGTLLRMDGHRWFNEDDLAGVLNWWGIPCERHQLLPTWMTDPLPFLVAALACILLVAASTLLLLHSAQEKRMSGTFQASLPHAVVLRLLLTREDDQQAIVNAREHLHKLAGELRHSFEYPVDVAVEVKSSSDCKHLEAAHECCDEDQVPLTSLYLREADKELESSSSTAGVVLVSFSMLTMLSAAVVRAMLARIPSDTAVSMAFATSALTGAKARLGIASMAQLPFSHPANGSNIVIVTSAGSGVSTAHVETIDKAIKIGQFAPGIDFVTSARDGLIEGVQSTPTLIQHIKRRWAWVRGHRMHALQTDRYLLALWMALEAGFHLAFLASLTYLLTTPVHLEYTPGDYGSNPIGWDCSNGKGSGLGMGRVLLAFCAAVYTGVYVAGLLRASPLGDGVLSLILQLSVMLFLLPAIAVVQLLCAFTSSTYLLLAHW